MHSKLHRFGSDEDHRFTVGTPHSSDPFFFNPVIPTEGESAAADEREWSG